MLIKLMKFLFEKLIGNIPEDKKKEFRDRLDKIIADVIAKKLSY